MLSELPAGGTTDMTLNPNQFGKWLVLFLLSSL